MLKLIFGTLPLRKKEYVYSLIKELAPKGGLYYVVPEQEAFERERDFLLNLGELETNRFTITSFSHLANEILEGRGVYPPAADDSVLPVFMKLALMQTQDSLDIYRRYVAGETSVDRLVTVYRNMRSSGVSPETLASAGLGCGESLREKTKELSIIFDAFESLLKNRLSLPADRIRQASRILETTDDYKDKVFVFDDFSVFSDAQHGLVREALKSGADCIVTVCAHSADADTENIPFEYARKNALEIIRGAKTHGISVETVNTDEENLNDEFCILSRGIFAIGERSVLKKSPARVHILTANDIYDECRFIGLKIKRLLDSGCRCRDIAVVERGAAYAPVITAVLKKYGIPVYEDDRRPFSDYPLVRELLLVCDIAVNGFDTEKILALIKTGLTPLDAYEAEILENYVYRWQTDRSAWKTDFISNPAGFGAEFDDVQKNLLEKINAAREKIAEPLVRLSNAVSKADNAADFCTAVYKYLISTGADKSFKKYADTLYSQGDEQGAVSCLHVWDETMKALNAVVFASGEMTLSSANCLSLIKTVFSAGSVGAIPAHIDEVTVGRADRTRLVSKKYVFAAGLSDGVFPSSPPSDGIFSSSEIEELCGHELKIELSDTEYYDEEKLSAYNLLMSAENEIWLSYPRFSCSGAKNEPSEIVSHVKKSFPALPFENYSELTATERICAPAEAFDALAENSGAGGDAAFAQALAEVLSEDENYAPKISRFGEKYINTQKSLAPETAKRLFGEKLRLSASKIDRYYLCPFSYFCQYGMGAESRRIERIDGRIKGLLIHAVFEQLFSRYKSSELSAIPVSQRRVIVSKTVSEYVKTFMGGERNLSPLVRRQIKAAENEINDVLDRIAEEFRGTKFETVAVELKIGGKNPEIPPYRLFFPGGEIEISGSIDRVDTYGREDGLYVRVIDYKSTGKTFRMTDVSHGLNMQMLIYLFALVKNGEEKFGALKEAGIFYVPAKGGKETSDRHAGAEITEKNKNHDLAMNGLVLADEDIVLAMDPGGGKKFISISAKDIFKDDKETLTPGEFIALHRLTDEKIKEMGLRLHNGEIPVAPKKTGSRGICDYCDYKSVCLIEPNVSPENVGSGSVPEFKRRLDEMLSEVTE